jgi:hypothetical protein
MQMKKAKWSGVNTAFGQNKKQPKDAKERFEEMQPGAKQDNKNAPWQRLRHGAE